MPITLNPINTVVPANPSLNILELSSTNPLINLVYPTTFLQSPNYLAALMLILQKDDFENGEIKFPDATLISPSVLCVISNIGSKSINVMSFDNTEIQLNIEPSTSYLISLTDNSTPGGEWNVIQIGATTSEANAEALAGLGLVAYNGKINCNVPTVERNIDIILSDNFLSVLVLWTGGTYEFILDETLITVQGYYFYLKNGSNAFLTLVTPTSTIDGKTSLVFLPNDSAIIIYDSENNEWRTVGSTTSSTSANTFELVDGSASSPPLSFLTSPTTGMFSVGGDDVSFTSAGTEVVNITQAGLMLVSGEYQMGSDSILDYATLYP